ncbi:HEAT repeat domain-containing protein [Myxococcus sp. RHSTA-1-4]|uniref:HEAT repeat domain-containing protein n=1 Tax=Myxococcus sp. RHSTA-1-4 TaxID=2874601 RepID=UPI001CBCDCCE|nr:HEAT repeat domain-containing protein [Myxococcus sp. RHSTA-1-4]MBZ4417697.1 HEAT repeat domain-containing protein [Myxococcus sp. RHSTA-1-4]
MKLLRPLAFALLIGCTTTPNPPPTTAEPPTASSATAPSIENPNAYTFEGVEVFGSRRYPREELLANLGLPAPGTKVDVESREFGKMLQQSKAAFTSRFRFALCRYSFVAYPGPKTVRLTIDLVDFGDEWRMRHTPAPTGDAEDPAGLISAWTDYLKKLSALQREGELPAGGPGDGPSWGRCEGGWQCFGGFGHPKLAGLEQKFIERVPPNFDALVKVLREDKDELERMSAIQLLSYVPDRRKVVEVLVPFVSDEAPGVRNEALRSIGTAQSLEQHLFIPLEPLLDALWYPQATDRNKAGWALVYVAERDEGKARKQEILRRVGELLPQMAGAGQRVDYEPAQRILKALSGEDFGSDVAAWRAWVDDELKR